MGRPLRRYSFALAERLGMTQRELYNRMTAAEIMEWLAYDRTTDPNFIESYMKEEELKLSESQSDEIRSEQIRRLLGG